MCVVIVFFIGGRNLLWMMFLFFGVLYFNKNGFCATIMITLAIELPTKLSQSSSFHISI